MEDRTRVRLSEIISRPPSKASIASDFQQLSNIVIVPVLEEFIKELKKGGHEAKMINDGGVELVVHPSGRSPGKLSFYPSGDNVFISIDGHSRGKVEQIAIDSILVEEHVLAFLETVF